MFRRTFLISGLMLLGFGRRAWARFTGVTNYLPLQTSSRLTLLGNSSLAEHRLP
jgi:hypothetical protein